MKSMTVAQHCYQTSPTFQKLPQKVTHSSYV